MKSLINHFLYKKFSWEIKQKYILNRLDNELVNKLIKMIENGG